MSGANACMFSCVKFSGHETIYILLAIVVGWGNSWFEGFK